MMVSHTISKGRSDRGKAFKLIKRDTQAHFMPFFNLCSPVINIDWQDQAQANELRVGPYGGSPSSPQKHCGRAEGSEKGRRKSAPSPTVSLTCRQSALKDAHCTCDHTPLQLGAIKTTDKKKTACIIIKKRRIITIMIYWEFSSVRQCAEGFLCSISFHYGNKLPKHPSLLVVYTCLCSSLTHWIRVHTCGQEKITEVTATSELRS